jgi:hypothetical protein
MRYPHWVSEEEKPAYIQARRRQRTRERRNILSYLPAPFKVITPAFCSCGGEAEITDGKKNWCYRCYKKEFVN